MLGLVVDGEAVVRRLPRDGAQEVARLPAGSLVRVAADGTRTRRWLRVTLDDGRSGFVEAPALVEVPDYRLEQPSAKVLDRPGRAGSPKAALRRRERFHVLSESMVDGERWLEVRLGTGKVGYLHGDTRVVETRLAAEDARGRPESLAMQRGLLGSVALMAVAAVWFVGGYRAGYVYFYPPALFFMGLLGLAREFVRRTGGRKAFGARGLTRRQWGILAGGAAVVVAGVVLAFASMGGGGSPPSVWLANGLDDEVTVAFGDRPVRLSPGALGGAELPPGKHRVVARTSAGEVLEEIEVEVPPRGRFAFYSVLGSAAVRVIHVRYDDPGSALAKLADLVGPHTETIACTSWTVRSSVDDPFTEPPEELKTERSSVTRVQTALLPGGWRTSVAAGLDLGKSAAAARLAARAALLRPTRANVDLAAQLLGAWLPAELTTFAERVVAASGGSVVGHRILQDARLKAGRRDETLAEYRAAHEADPGSAPKAFLHARLLAPAEARPVLEGALKAHPDDPWLLGATAWNLASALRYAEALAHFERLGAVDPAAMRPYVGIRARALVALGRTPDAQRLVRALPDPAFDEQVLYAKLGRLPDADPAMPPPERLVGEGSPGDAGSLAGLVGAQAARTATLARIAAFARDAQGYGTGRVYLDGDVRVACRIVLESSRDVAIAAESAVTATQGILANLDDAARVAIAAELVRTGKVEAAARVFGGEGAVVLDALFSDLSAPESAMEDETVFLDARAVLAHAASRRAQDPAERARLLERARALDVLRCLVPR